MSAPPTLSTRRQSGPPEPRTDWMPQPTAVASEEEMTRIMSSMNESTRRGMVPKSESESGNVMILTVLELPTHRCREFHFCVIWTLGPSCFYTTIIMILILEKKYFFEWQLCIFWYMTINVWKSLSRRIIRTDHFQGWNETGFPTGFTD